MPAASATALLKRSPKGRPAWVWPAPMPTGRAGLGASTRDWAEAVFLPGARHQPLGTEGSGGNVCFRNKLQASGCTGPEEPSLLRSQEEVDPFLELQHQGGHPSFVVWTNRSPRELPPSSPLLPLCPPGHHPGPLLLCQLLRLSAPRGHFDFI